MAAWLAVPAFFVLGSGPLSYCQARGWVSLDTGTDLYRPFLGRLKGTPFGDHWIGYNRLWRGLAERHAASD